MKISKKELNNLKFYIAERDRLLVEINDLSGNIKDGYTSIDFSYTRGGKVKDDSIMNLALHNMKYEKMIKNRLNKLNSIILKMYKIIDMIDDPKVRNIVELRVIKCKKWEEIGKELKYEFSNCSKIYKKFIDGDE